MEFSLSPKATSSPCMYTSSTEYEAVSIKHSPIPGGSVVIETGRRDPVAADHFPRTGSSDILLTHKPVTLSLPASAAEAFPDSATLQDLYSEYLDKRCYEVRNLACDELDVQIIVGELGNEAVGE
eukprot:sb/3475614/